MNSKKPISFSIPLPPSVNEQYVNHKPMPGDINPRGRHLTKIARAYKNSVALQIALCNRGVKYGKDPISVTIIVYPKDRRRDEFNCEKIVFDAIQESGIIENDRQIIHHEMIVLPPQGPTSWIVSIKPVTIEEIITKYTNKGDQL